MRWLGALLIVCASAGIGFRSAVELRARPRRLHALADGIRLLRSDICDRLLPLPEALLHAAESAPPALAGAFRHLGEAIGTDEHAFAVLWHAAFASLDPLRPEERNALFVLGEQLGKYDAETQVRAADACIRALEAAEAEARAYAKQYGRLCSGLGITAGLLLAVSLW